MNDAMNCPQAKNGKPCICRHHKIIEYLERKRAEDKNYDPKELFNVGTEEYERKINE